MKIAVVGLGRFGNTHLRTIDSLDCCELAAVCDINKEIAIQYAEKYGVPYYTDYKVMADMCDADAVIINLPHFLHCEATVFFLEHGFHVFVEKPMARNVEEYRIMNEAQHRTGKILAVGHPQRFFHANREVRRIVETGEYGKLLMISEFRSSDYFEPGRPRWFLTKELSGGGIMMNLGAHAFDKLMYITGSKPTEIVSAVDNCLDGYDVEGHVQSFIRFENGVSATVTFNSYYSVGYESLFHFEKGALKVINSSALYRYENREWVRVELPASPDFMQMEVAEFVKLVKGEPSEMPLGDLGEDVIDAIERVYNG